MAPASFDSDGDRTPLARPAPERATHPDRGIAARWLWCGLFMMAGLVPSALQAQSAQLDVRLLGDADRPVAGVRIELRGPALDEPLTRISDALGRAVFPELPVGPDYRLRTLHVGFHTVESELFSLAADERAVRELHLAREVLGTDTLRIFTSPLRIRRDDAGFTARIDRSAIELLPTPYAASDLVVLTAGARPGQIWGGAAEQANAYHLDGLPQTHPGTGGAFVEPSVRWIERLEVRGLGASAEHGNFQGGLVNVVTRSGSNVRSGGLRVSGESAALNSTNLVRTEIGVETDRRLELEGERAGPILHDRLFYFLGGHLVQERRRAQAHVPQALVVERFLPWTEDRLEFRGFGKLTWEPSFRNRVELSGGVTHRTIQNFGLNGYQTENAVGRLENPTGYYNLSWDHTLGTAHRLEASLAGFHARSELDSPLGSEVPGARFFTQSSAPVFQFQNPERSRIQRPSSTTATLRWRWEGRGLGADHEVLAGAEISRGGWEDRMLRNGDMSWRPLRLQAFDMDDPATWTPSTRILPTEWGGEVNLDARVANDALFIQDQITVSDHLSLSPGLRLGRWWGEILPAGDGSERLRALEDRALDPRLGITVDPTGTNRLVLKGHWGRYHQGMMAQFFDRVEGAGVFTNREIWYLRGEAPEDPRTSFTQAERDAMSSGDPRFERSQIFRMNEEGRAAPDYRQPYVEQWVAGIEVQPTDRIRAELIWVHRANHRMVGLVDRNLESNYTRYENVRISIDIPDDPIRLELGGEPLVLPELWIPNDLIRERLVAAAEVAEVPIPPGFTLADTTWLSYEPDLWLQNLDEARRRFQQLQVAVHASFPGWGASASLVWTHLEGTMNSVTGYESGTDFQDFDEMGAGPFVRPNEQANFQGPLPGFSPLELKLALHGDLGWGIRAGAFLNAAKGDRFTPYFRQQGTGGILYELEDGRTLEEALAYPVQGQRIFVRPRGSFRYADRVTLDLRFDRPIPGTGDRLRATLDLFNVWNSDTPTEILSEVNVGTVILGQYRAPRANERFGAVRERVRPRTFRLGLQARF